MSTLVAVGDSVDRIVSWGAIATTADGKFWNSKISPFNRRGKCLGIAFGNINNQQLYYVIGDGGLASSSLNRNTWNTEKIWLGNFQPLSILYCNNAFYTCGQYKFFDDESIYKTNDEVAIIMKNTTGAHSDWEPVYTHRYSNSRFYNVRYVDTDRYTIIFALGSDNNKPLAIYSLDYGFTWNRIEFPSNLNIKYIYDCCFTKSFEEVTCWVTTDGYILKNIISLNNGIFSQEWEASRSFLPKFGKTDFIKIATNGSAVVAVCSGGVAYTTDQSTWKFLEQPGYSFRSVQWFNNTWIVGAESLLTQYTHWTSTDTVNWIPENCGVQIFDSIII